MAGCDVATLGRPAAPAFRGRECSQGHQRPGTCSTCQWFDSHEVTGSAADGGECFHPDSPPTEIRGSYRHEVGFYDFGHAPWCFLGRHQSCEHWQERTEPGVSVEVSIRDWEETFGARWPG